MSTRAPKDCGYWRVCPPRGLGPLCSCPPSCLQNTLARGTSPGTESAELNLSSLGVSSFLRDYQFSGSCPSPIRLRSQARAWHQLCWLGGGSEATKLLAALDAASPVPWRRGNKRLGAQRDLSGPTTTGWGEGARGGTPPLHSPSTTDSSRHFHRRKFPEVRGGKRLIPFIQWAPPPHHPLTSSLHFPPPPCEQEVQRKRL